MRRLLTLSLAAVVLAGCAGEPYRFFRDNTTQADYDRDSYECERDARQVERSFGYGYDRQQAAFTFLVRCMTAKGYRWLPVSQVRGQPVNPGIVQGPPTPMTDHTGRTYAPSDSVMCGFPTTAPTKMPAQTCSQGRGTILGAAQ